MNRATISLIILMLLMAAAFELRSSWRNQTALAARNETQQPLLQEVDLVKTQLRSILLETRSLASQGNENAALLVAELQRQGVRFTDP